MPYFLRSMLQTLAVCFIVILGAGMLYAWSGPSGSPPGNNTPAPINTGSNTQTKSGSLHLQNGVTFTGGFSGSDNYISGNTASFSVIDDGSGGEVDFSSTLMMNNNDIHLADQNVGGPNNRGVRKINFENHEWRNFSCWDSDNVAGSLFYDRSEGLGLCRKGNIETLASKDYVDSQAQASMSCPCGTCWRTRLVWNRRSDRTDEWKICTPAGWRWTAHEE